MMNSENRKAIRLKAKIARRVERRHLWVFSNEVESVEGEPRPGDEVYVFAAKGNFLGMGLYSASSLIRARIYSRRFGQACDGALIRERLRAAREYRRVIPCTALPDSYRLIHSEADGLPGLVVDVFGDHVVMQIATAGMEARREEILASIIEVLAPRAVIERSDMAHRELEGLAPRREVAWGEPETPSRIEENGVTVLADLAGGQKTGYYLDQVGNRAAAAPFFAGRSVLDLFCYVGAWSLAAARAGAARTLGVDTSGPALELARRAVALNKIDPEQCAFNEADVFQFLREQVDGGARYGAVVLDPPALAKSRRDAEAALRAYRELNLRAMQLVEDGGLLVTCSCSHAVAPADFNEMLVMAAKDARADFAVWRQAGQGADHPVHLATPETAYLKAYFLVRREI